MSIASFRNFPWLKRDPDKPSNFGPSWRVILNTLVIFIASQLVAIFLVEVGLTLVHGSSSGLSKALEQSASAQFFYVLIAEALAVFFVLMALRGRGLTLAAIGWGRRPARRDLTRGLLGFGAFYILLIITSVILTLVFPDLNVSQKQDVGFNHLPTVLDGILAFVALVFLPPLGEETLVRGYLYSGLRSKWRFIPALLVTSLLFSIAHLQPGNPAGLVWGAAINTFLLSVILVYLRENTGALYAGVLVHALNNVIAFGVHFHG
jgi:membrane protease YdiL (CAAX protease family)